MNIFRYSNTRFVYSIESSAIIETALNLQPHFNCTSDSATYLLYIFNPVIFLIVCIGLAVC